MTTHDNNSTASAIQEKPTKTPPLAPVRVKIFFDWKRALIPVIIGLGMLLIPTPGGLEPRAWHMLALFVAYMVANVLQMKNTPAGAEAEAEAEAAEEEMTLTKTLVLLVAGAVLIAVGANLLVDNGTLIAQALGVPESVIALTFVALGTSLPELVTAITSLVKGCSDLSLGNIVGANVFNLVLVSGASVTIAPFTIPQSSTLFGINSSLVLDLPVMLAVMVLMCVPALVRGKLSRVQGVLLLCIYAAFCAIQFTM